jgi:DNA-3-methyladenine glycosylase
MTTDAAHLARRLHIGPTLPRSFYDRETEVVSRELLGAVLECVTPEGTTAGVIVETEAYLGEHDPACHAAVGRTKRTSPLYGKPGTAYVYFIYGMYWCVNAVTRREGLPSAVLIRALEPVTGIELMRSRRPRARSEAELCNGPGKLCLALGITGEQNGVTLQRLPLRIRTGISVPDHEVGVTPRIGITRAHDWPLRWLVADSPYASRSRRR